MAKIKNENFIAIQGFMVKELGLSGNELIAYALIYGFSQDNESEFSSGGSSGGSSSSTHKVTYDKNNNPNKPALKSNDYWTYEKLSKKGYSTSGQASSQISNYASKGANGFTQIGNKYFIVKWIANAGSPANASKAKNKLEKDHPKKIGKYGYAKRYHKGLELGKIEALPKIKPLIWCRI